MGEHLAGATGMAVGILIIKISEAETADLKFNLK
jgi:hypothetical protein